MSSLGKKIKALRQEKDLSLRKLAARVKITPPFLSDIENDKRMPSPDTLKSLAEQLSVSVTELEKYDGRITEEVKEWLNEKPLMGTLMRKMAQMSPAKRDELVSKIQQVVEDPEAKKSEKK